MFVLRASTRKMVIFRHQCRETVFEGTADRAVWGAYRWFCSAENLCGKSELRFFLVSWRSLGTHFPRSEWGRNYFSVFAEGACLFAMRSGHFLVHPQTLILHFAHNLSGLLVIELVQLIPFGLLALSGLLLTLLLLLHHYFVPYHLFHDYVVEDVPEQIVLHRCKN